ncbi:hypothetical protein CRUP_015909 [Coryphaenoides rupestris]|nr:hypothetical protein CRUP_015909 [Coryphaenoides rupestris]
MYHVHRRRRLVRPRRRAELPAGGAMAKRSQGDPEGWEFSSLIGWNFHRKERSSDTFRRRRWRRKMAPEGRLGAAAIFNTEEADKASDSSTKAFGANTPTVSCSFDRSFVYHLRVYVYQARGMTKTTEKLKATLNPTWDQTLIFNDLELYGDPQSLARQPPSVVLEFYDHDQVGKDELLGRTVFSPRVEVISSRGEKKPKLLWYPIIQKGQRAGEALLAAELLLKDKLLPKEEMYTPPIVLKVIDHRPFGRKPVVGQCTIASVERFRCDPYVVTADGAMANKMSLMMSASPHLSIGMEETRPLLETQEQETVDWWSKFYASVGNRERSGEYLKKGYDTLTVYDDELEDLPGFHGLTDFCDTFRLERGKTGSGGNDPSVVGEFKGSFRVYPLSDDPGVMAPPRQFRELPDSGPQECLVRIYIIRAIDLQPKDNNGRCDPYMRISLGRNTVDDSDNYIPNTTNPVFGKMFEMSCYLPQEKDLKISVYDYDLLTRDEKVGETVIDLENRFLSRYNAYCGLPQTYCISGINQWRDQMKPSQILENVARLKGLSKPRTEDNGNTLTFQGTDYTLAEFEANQEIHQHLGPPRERMCLHVLRTQGLVPEHVETRTLYSSFQPTLSQGKLQMWVDVFPKSIGLPGPPFDITPRKAKKNILRVVVWNTTDVTLDETSITGEHMSDIYVKGWMPGMEEDKQKTDVHYRSLDGDGNFNWRFIFNFDYLPAEELCLVSKKENFWSLDKSEFRIPPKLIVQIWDNDKFSLDDYLGVVELDLRSLVPPAKTPEKCGLQMMDNGPDKRRSEQTKSLFAQKSVRGWWPCAIEKDGRKELGGKVELTLEIVCEEDADQKPAGKGRDEPNMNPKLDPPNRPDTSFFWFTNPCKTMKFIVWRRFRCLFITLIILTILGLFLAIFLYSLPNYISMKLIKPLS